MVDKRILIFVSSKGTGNEVPRVFVQENILPVALLSRDSVIGPRLLTRPSWVTVDEKLFTQMSLSDVEVDLRNDYPGYCIITIKLWTWFSGLQVWVWKWFGG